MYDVTHGAGLLILIEGRKTVLASLSGIWLFSFAICFFFPKGHYGSESNAC